jgi:hypothetical protein
VSGRFFSGVEISQQPTHAETGDDEKHREIRQEKNSVAPQVDLLARADGQAIDGERRCSGRVVIVLDSAIVRRGSMGLILPIYQESF